MVRFQRLWQNLGINKGGIKMIQVKDRHYFISERLIKYVFERDNRYFIKLNTDEVQEIEETTYLNLGGKV